jgi:hypothetical protein
MGEAVKYKLHVPAAKVVSGRKASNIIMAEYLKNE